MPLSRLPDIDRELAAFELSEERLHLTRQRAHEVRRALAADGDLDQVLLRLGVRGAVPAPAAEKKLPPRLDSQAPPGLVAHPTTWDEARRPPDPIDEDGSGLLDMSDESLRSAVVPPVLALEALEAPDEASESRPPLSESTALYIDPPTNPPPAAEAKPEPATDMLALDLDPEAGLVEPGAAPLSYVPAPKASTPAPPRPSAVPAPSVDDLFAEMMEPEAPIEVVSVEAPLEDVAAPNVSLGETTDALAAMQAAELGVGIDDLGDDFGELDREDVAPERTVMMRADALHALLPPAATEPEAVEAADADMDIELDIDEDVLVIDEDPASQRSRPPPPPSRPPEGSKSRPPEPPGKGFLSRLLKGNKPS